MHTAILLMGGNTGDVRMVFEKAIEMMKKKGWIIQKASSVYSSVSWGYASKNIYYNQAIEIKTILEAETLLDQLLEIEKDLGRIRDQTTGYSDRNIDIDMIFYDDQVIETPRLTIPHPRMHVRNFCLVPVHEILPEFIHPVFNKTIADLLWESPDTSEVKKP